MTSRLWRIQATWVVILSSVSSLGADIPTDVSRLEKEKSQFTLFHPTPKMLMREFNTDRPDKTESPYTVDAGHFQYESDIVRYIQDRADDGTLARLWSVNVMNLKVGLTNQLDFQVILPMYNVLSFSSASSSYRGYGDTFLRVKYNFFGNDGGAIAFGVMPYVKIPTAASGLGNNRTDGGIIFPIALSFPDEWSSGLMFVYSKALNDTGEGYHSELLSSWTLHHPVLARTEGYIEIYSRSSNEAGASWVATFDLGLIYTLMSNVKLDAGINLGLTPAADDLNPFVGLSFRL